MICLRPLAAACLGAALTLPLLVTATPAGAASATPAGAAPASLAAATAPAPLDRLIAGGAWLADEVPASGLLPSPFGEGLTDPGLSIDVLLALTALGAHQDVRDRIMAAIEADSVAYTGFGDPAEKAAGATAKLLYAAAVHGADVTSFDGRNLRQDVLDLVTASGRVSDVSEFGDFSNTFAQAFAILGLVRTGGVEPLLITYLARQQCSDGGFRLFIDEADATCAEVDGTSDPDATAMAIQALLAAQQAGVAQASPLLPPAINYLAGLQLPNGAFPSGGPEGVPNTGSTGLAAQALAAAGRSTAAAQAVTYLLANQRTSGPEVGAIAFNAEAFGTGTQPITAGERDQYRRATAQALLGLAQISFGQLGAVPGVIEGATLLRLNATSFVRWPTGVVLTGTLRDVNADPLPGRTVMVIAKQQSKSGLEPFRPVLKLTTNAAGVFRGTIRPTVHTVWQASYAGSATERASASGYEVTKVQVAHPSVNGFGATLTVGAGTSVNVSGRSLPGALRTPVVLQWIRPDGIFNLTTAAVPAATGSYVLSREFGVRGTYRLRVLAVNTANNFGSASRTFTLRVV